MNLGWLEDFLAVGRLRNFSKAAVTRHATQSGLSRRIKALEEWYGVPLIDRRTHPVVLTEAGSRFMAVSEELVSELYRSRREARAEVGAAGRTFRFAMPHSLAVNFFPAWWRSVRGHAELSAKLTAGDLSECVELLLNGDCQFLLYYASEATPNGLENINLRRRHVGTERLLPISKVGSRGAPLFDFERGRKGGPIPLLAYTSDSFLGRVTARVHAQLETRCLLTLRYQSSLVEALKAEAMLGEGVAWLPESNVRQEIASKVLCAVGNDSLAIPLDIWLCGAASASVSANAKRFLGDLDANGT